MLIFPLSTVAQSSSVLFSQQVATINWSPENTQQSLTADTTNSPLFWANGGLGVGTTGIAGIAGLSYQFEANMLSLRTSITGGVANDDFWDVGILYGRAASGSFYHASLSAGVGLVGGRRGQEGLLSSEPVEQVPRSIGFPLEGQLFWQPTVFLGIGLSGFANINGEQSFGGIAISLQVGNFK